MKTARITSTCIVLGALLASCGGNDCPEGFFDLGGICVDLSSDPENCGGFGATCPPGQYCEAGVCVLSCPEGHENCDGVCRDLTEDDYNCGSCGLVCAAGYACVDGSCAPQCPDGYTACSGICKNLDNDPANCGECGAACAAGEVCSSGACSFTCPAPYEDCSGSCADLSTDHRSCGACGTACATGQVCEAGSCVNSCLAGLVMCSGACADLMRDPDNCGACATRCSTGENCYDGVCIAACPGGFTDCSGTCRDLDSDRFNCGACETECDEGHICDAGACSLNCASPLVECTGVCTNLSYDRLNCGSCGTVCGMREACVSGTCQTITMGGPKNILFVSDASSDTNIPTALTGDGHTVTTVTGDFAAGNATLLGSLMSYHMVYWSATGSGSGSAHSSTVITNLESYVAAGGCVFVTGYDSIASPSDPDLIGFVGGTGSVDLPGAPGPVSSTANALNWGVVDIMGVTPTGGYSDKDGLTGLSGVDVVAYSGSGTSSAQWTIRTLGSGMVAYVSNGQSGTSAHASWTTTTSGGAGAYNAALRNFAFNCF
jgi:hypothetical protein